MADNIIPPGGKQLGAWLEKPGPDARVEIRSDLPIPEPREGEALVKLECTGVWLASSPRCSSPISLEEPRAEK